jgi:hypothetical protein
MGDSKQLAPPGVAPASPTPAVGPPAPAAQRGGNQAAPMPAPAPAVATPTLDAAAQSGGPGPSGPKGTASPPPPSAPPAGSGSRPDPGAEGRRVAATVQEALRSEWSLFGASKSVDPKAAIASLAGQPPEVLAAARAQYRAATGRNLEDDLRSELGDRDARAAMGHLWNGMNTAERARYHPDGAAVADVLQAPTPTDLELQRTDPKRYQQMRIETARAAIVNANGILDDDEDEAMQVFGALSVSERKELLRQFPNVVSYMNAAEKGRFHAMARSEAEAVQARAQEAMAGLGTDENALAQSMKSLRGLADEQQRLVAALATGALRGPEAEAAKKRLAEIGDVASVAKVERTADGSVKGFLGAVESELSSGEFKGHLDTLGNKKEAATQAVLNATGSWFGDDEDAVYEAVASLPKDQRDAFVKDRLVGDRIRSNLGRHEQATVRSFVADDQVAMAQTRVSSASGTFAQDEAKVLQTILELSPADRATFADTQAARYARAQMDPRERAAFDEAMTGRLSLETGMAAAAGGSFDGTNEDLMALASQKKSAAETEQIRTGYLLARSGRAPASDAEREALRKYRAVDGVLAAELSTDDRQSQVDTLVGGATDAEKGTAAGRDRAAQILVARQEDRADTIGGMFTWWSETDDTARTSAIATSASLHQARGAGGVGADDLQTIQSRDEVFQTRFAEMVEAQNTATDAAATGVGAVVSAAAVAATGGAATPLVAAGWAAAGTGASMATKALVGGDRYSAEAAGMDAVSGALSFGTSLGTGAVAGKVMQGASAGLGKTAGTAAIDNALGTAAGSVTGSLLDDKIWEKAPDQVLAKVGTDLVSTKNAVGFGVGTLAATTGGAIHDARTQAPTSAVSPARPTATTADPAVPHAAAPAPVTTPHATEPAAPAAPVERHRTQAPDAPPRVADAPTRAPETLEARTSRIMNELDARLMSGEDLHLVEWALEHLNDLDAIDEVLRSHPRRE